MKTLEHFVPNGDGWHLSLFQTWDEARLVPGRRPVLIVPGYGMNSFIFSYHPHGDSLEGYLVHAGFEVWRVDLRAQGESVSVGGSDSFGLEDLAVTDLGAAIRAALDRSRTGADRVDIIGASLGGTIIFLHAALQRDNRLGSIVAMGSPGALGRYPPCDQARLRSPRWSASCASAARASSRGSRSRTSLDASPWLLVHLHERRASPTSAPQRDGEDGGGPESPHQPRDRLLDPRQGSWSSAAVNLSEALARSPQSPALRPRPRRRHRPPAHRRVPVPRRRLAA